MKRPGLALNALAAIVLLSAACASGRPARKADADAAALPPAPAATVTAAARVVDAEPDARDLAAREIPELAAVRFAYDADLLDDAARAVLRSNADYLKAHPDLRVQVAGNCDQRGTTAYNLALGQRRAAAVRDFYRRLGVAASRVATISYGKERPLCVESTEDCWARNRRAATLELLGPAVADGAAR